MAPPIAPSSSNRLRQTQFLPGAIGLGMARSPAIMNKSWMTPSRGNARAGAETRDFAPPLDSGYEGVGPSRPTGSRDDSGSDSQARNITPSSASTSGLPRIPSMLLLDNTGSPRESKGKAPMAVDPAGLGLYFNHQHQASARVPSPSPTLFEPINLAELPPLGSQVPSTRQGSSTDGGRNISPDPTFMQRMMEAKRLGPPLDVTSAQQQSRTLNFDDFIHSATEVATPSIRATPDLAALDHLVQETKGLAEVLTRATAGANSNALAQEDQANPGRTSAAAADRGRGRLTPSPASQSSSIQAARRRMPSTFDRLVSNLNSLNTQLTSFPHSVQRLSDRVDVLETASFCYVPPEVFQERFEMVDTRLVDAEQRLDEHGRRLAAVETTQAESQQRHGSHAGSVAPPDSSFGSHNSVCSATSSALIAAAIEQAETEAKLKDIEERLGDLETIALPSFARPWEIEVVLLPWGRELRGIWFSPEQQLTRPGSKPTTQDEEEAEDWTHARTLKSQFSTSTSFHSSHGPGWSSQAIHDWANDADEWLTAKACGTNGVVYYRLRSRGLVRKVSLTSPSAKDTQHAIRSAFGDLMAMISGNIKDDEDSQLYEDDAHNRTYYGLNAPFVPLRKVHKSSRLRFLTPSEMVTPAIWTAEFLASGVLMRAAGGQKRLFVTHREAYLQRAGDGHPSWTWKKLRELPRFHLDDASKGEDHLKEEAQEAQVPEGDAREACWAHHPTLDDPPPSLHSSFTSLHSHVSVVRTEPAVAAYHPGSPTEKQSHIEEERSEAESRPVQPITPISEYPTQGPMTRGRMRRQRTVSVPLTEASSAAAPGAVPMDLDRTVTAKRRVQSFEAPTNPLIDKLPVFISPQSRSRTTLVKRRRITRSSERSLSGSWLTGEQASQVPLSAQLVRAHPTWASFTPRTGSRQTSGESKAGPDGAPSPFFESAGFRGSGERKRRSEAEFLTELNAMIAEDMRKEKDTTIEDTTYGSASIGSRKRGTTPFAYATPYSGPIGVSIGMKGDHPIHHGSMDEDAIWEGVDEQDRSESEQEDEDSDEEEGSDEMDLDDDEGEIDEEEEPTARQTRRPGTRKWEADADPGMSS
jgi:hypothetical protein